MIETCHNFRSLLETVERGALCSCAISETYPFEAPDSVQRAISALSLPRTARRKLWVRATGNARATGRIGCDVFFLETTGASNRSPSFGLRQFEVQVGFLLASSCAKPTISGQKHEVSDVPSNPLILGVGRDGHGPLLTECSLFLGPEWIRSGA